MEGPADVGIWTALIMPRGLNKYTLKKFKKYSIHEDVYYRMWLSDCLGLLMEYSAAQDLV